MRLGDERIARTEDLAPRDGTPAPFGSPPTVTCSDHALGFRTGAMLRGPDGHALRVRAH